MAATSERDNNFDAVRLIAALAVVVGHAWPLTGLTHPPAVAGIPMFTIAVYVFFTLSGYLVGTSWVRDPRPLAFLTRRVSRIFPALIVVVVLTVFVIGPLVTTLPIAHYFASPTTWGYLGNVSLLATYDLPGVFADHPRPVVNGVLWTLGPEFTCYLGVLAIGLLANATRRAVPGRGVAIAFGVVAVGLAALCLAPIDLGTAAPAMRAMVFFGIGSALAHGGVRRMPVWAPCIAIIVWVAGSVAFPGQDLLFAWVALPVIVLAIGQSSWPVFRAAGRFGDFSYGTYLWGFLVQQVVFQLVPAIPLGADVALVVVITVGVAAASWHLVEKRALGLGRRLASRRYVRPIPQGSAALPKLR
ncbi:MAG: acyltransferase family protein [Schumannella sp.]|nr:acyltransferase family protein [Schumannella sp.]